jgi:hypothetical protein
VTRDIARDLSGVVGELASLKADVRHWLEGPEYAALRLSPENAHAAAEAALVEARRRVRMNEGAGELSVGIPSSEVLVYRTGSERIVTSS